MNFKFGLVGHPLLGSRSPAIHGAALHEFGIQGEYRLYLIPPLPEGQAALATLLERLRRGELDGINVTIPHKQALLPMLDELTPAAGAIGAVNTLYARAGRLVGDNTDAAGFLKDLEQTAQHFGVAIQPGQTALVLGAGGAARAVVYALLSSGWQVTVVARRLEQAQRLAADMAAGLPGITGPSALPLAADPLAGLPEPLMLLVNATSLGMLPDSASNPWPAGLPLPRCDLVYDLVYKPEQTALLRQARQAGLPAVNGLGMLVEQAALAFETWTNLEAPRPAMRRAAGLT